MRYLIYSEPVPPGWEWDPLRPVSGTTEFYVRTAQETLALAEDNEVMVIYDGPLLMAGGRDADHDRLVYVPRDEAADAVAHFDAEYAVVCNYSAEHHRRDLTEIWPSWLAYWCNRYSDSPKMTSDAERTLAGLGPGLNIVVSEFHRKQLLSHGIENTTVVPHGVDHDKYRCDPEDKENLAIFTSSYDRGGRYLEDLWARRRLTERTGVKLYVSDYGKDVHGSTRGLMGDDEMTGLYKRAKWWIHPGQGVELFCISGVKAQAAGCTPIVVPEMALAETVRWGFRSAEEDLALNIERILTSKITTRANADHVPSWREATQMLWNAV
jgi:glycosyltransferase involved in cell wall biosynthesis